MRVIGITGGIGAGKSMVTSYLSQRYKAHVLEADVIARRMQAPGGICYDALRNLLGETYYDEEGNLRRGMLAEAIFRDPGLRERVNQVVHPYVLQQIGNEINEIYDKEEEALVVVEAALIFEGGVDLLCSEVWYVYASEELRIKRLMNDRGYSEERCRDIISSQMSEEQFDMYCDFRIENDMDETVLHEQIDRLLGV